MSERTWHRSLYWRLGVGIVLLLLLMLLLQAGAMIFTLSRAPVEQPVRLLQRVAITTALELERALAREPDLDLRAFLAERFPASPPAVAIVRRDGEVFASARDPVPEELRRAVQYRLERGDWRGRMDRFERGSRRASQDPPEGEWRPDGEWRPERFLLLPRAFGLAPVRVGDEAVAAVVVLPSRPLRSVLRDFGPALIGVALRLTLGGTAVAVALVFGPAHRRLRGLEEAAERIGAGDQSARAPSEGGDEIAAVAAAFNAMADKVTRHVAAVETADTSRRQLLADVSHELMTPLTSMRGYLETLRMPELALDAATRQRYLGIALDETLRLEGLIGDLLELSRLDAGGVALRAGPVPVTALFERVRERHGREAADRQIAFTTDVDDPALIVEADEDRLEQVLQNLAANALRHSPPGRRIALRARREAEQVVLAVADSGPGIPPQHLPYIFDRFYKADPSRSGAPGSGLGLSIVKAIVERHGGTVAARSTPGVETVFEVRLPARAAPGLRDNGGAPAAAPGRL
jgi:two-component system, OmpR family, sensor kinase